MEPKTNRILSLFLAFVLSVSVLAPAAAAQAPASAAASTAASDETQDVVAYGKENYPDLEDISYRTYRTLDYNKRHYFYNFRTSWQAGASSLKSIYLGSDSPGFYGVFASADKNVVTYETYSELDNVEVHSVQLRTYDDLESVTLKNSGQFEVTTLPNGPYKFWVWFNRTEEDGTVKIVGTSVPLYISAGSAYFADWVETSMYKNGFVNFSNITIEEWLEKNGTRFTADSQLQNWIAEHGGDDLEAALRVDHITYPFYSNTRKYPNDAPRWRALAHEICPDEDAGNYTKAYLLHEWMSHNLVYDLRKIANADGSEREKSIPYRWAENGGGEWTMWNTHIGVCYDFANVYAIMCRELGVPCRVLYDERINHTFNIVYLNGHWDIVDLTSSVKSYYIENTKAALQEFWENWEGPGREAEYSKGFIIRVYLYSWYKVYYGDTKTVLDKMAGISAIDNYLSTKKLLQDWGPQYNH